MSNPTSLIDILKSPEYVCEFSCGDWDLLIRQARAKNLLAHLYIVLLEADLVESIPQKPKEYLLSAFLTARSGVQAVKWELSVLQEALYKLAIPLVILKGAAYAVTDLPISRGRLFHDIDILVPKSAINEIEELLVGWGWRTSHTSQYDQRYYRTWMHEIPPLVHSKRKTVLDIHHAILPLTANVHPDSKKLLEKSVRVENHCDVYRLNDVDMVLHSATHLFYEGEFSNGLRDLVDLHSLINNFSKKPGFWGDLSKRAEELNLTRPLFYGLRYTGLFLGLQIPTPQKPLFLRLGSPNKLIVKIMDALYLRAFQSGHESLEVKAVRIAEMLLYIRSHYLRMPLRLLIPHLIRKAVIHEENEKLPKDIQNFLDARKR